MIKTTFLDKSLYAAVSQMLSEEAHKPTPEDSIKNRNSPVWANVHSVNGSSMLFQHTKDAAPVMEHLFIRPTEKVWEYGIKEKIHRNLDNDNEKVHTIYNNHHFVERVTNPERNYKGLTGNDIVGFKDRVVKKINELGLVGQLSHNKDHKEHHFLSTTDKATKDHTLVTRIYPSGKVQFVTMLDPTMKNDRKSNFMSLVESVYIDVTEV